MNVRCIEILTEEPSAAAAVGVIAPKILPQEVHCRAIDLRSKQAMLRDLPAHLRAYAKRVTGQDLKVLVLIDRDREDCEALKRRLEDMAAEAGLMTRSRRACDEAYHLANRIVVEELEAWFIGDEQAVRAAYPKVGAFAAAERYRHPDEIRGGTWEALRDLLVNAGHFQGRFPKVEVARNIASHMNPDRNRSPSFRCFRDALLELATAQGAP